MTKKKSPSKPAPPHGVGPKAAAAAPAKSPDVRRASELLAQPSDGSDPLAANRSRPQAATPILSESREVLDADDDRPAPAPRVRRMKVRATRNGYYDDILRRPGDVFTISGDSFETVLAREAEHQPVDAEGEVVRPPSVRKRQKADRGKPAAFSARWMEEVESDTPESKTGNNEIIRRAHDAVLADRIAGKRSTGDAAVLGD